MDNKIEELKIRLSQENLRISAFVEKQLLEYTDQLYPVLLFLIDAQVRVTGLKSKLDSFFLLSTNRIDFASQLNEIICVYFIENQLRQTVIEVETINRQIVSPNCSNGKSCDILAIDGSEKVYYESKKNMAQDLNPRENPIEFDGYTPLLPTEVRQWIRNKLVEANKKGANYLLVRLPFWTAMALMKPEVKYKHWTLEVFENATRVARNHFKIKLDGLNLTVTKGFYVLFPDDHVKIEMIN